MPGIASLFNIGKQSLFANQSAIEVVGNNISNANTEGYSRQAVRFEDGYYISYTPGQLGTGVNAAEVIRYFDEFTELMYNTKSSEQQRWQKLYENLQNVEMIFNESNAQGVNSALSAFWADWQTLATNPGDTSVRAALLGHASNLEQGETAPLTITLREVLPEKDTQKDKRGGNGAGRNDDGCIIRFPAGYESPDEESGDEERDALEVPGSDPELRRKIRTRCGKDTHALVREGVDEIDAPDE